MDHSRGLRRRWRLAKVLEVAQPRKRNVGTNVREMADRGNSKLLPVATDIEFDGPPSTYGYAQK